MKNKLLYISKNFLWAGLVSFIFVTSLSAATADTSKSEYSSGIELFKDGDYGQALQHFESARRKGNEDPALIYNLAVTHYKLEQYEQAERYFRELVDQHPDWRDVGTYNLGRIAMRRGNEEAAAKLFREVRRTASNEKLVRLAGEGLTTLAVPGEFIGSEPDRKSFVLLSVSGGIDDNVIAFPDQIQTSSSQGEDSFLEYLAFGQHRLKGTDTDGIRVHGFVYARQYDELDSMDVNTFMAGITRDTSYNDWGLEYGGDAGYTEVGGDELGTRLQGRLKLLRGQGLHQYSAQYQPVYHDGGSQFSAITGFQHRFDLRYRYHFEHGRWTVRYRMDYNDRDDLAVDGTFLSYSPFRNSLLLEGQWYASQDVTLIAGAEFSNSRYSKDNSLTDADGVFKTMERESDTFEFWVKGQYQLHPDWRLLAEYRYTDNDDNFVLYDYDRSEAKLSIEFSY
ncbi:MAG: porin family protein [Pseudomonadales bacterium]